MSTTNVILYDFTDYAAFTQFSFPFSSSAAWLLSSKQKELSGQVLNKIQDEIIENILNKDEIKTQR